MKMNISARTHGRNIIYRGTNPRVDQYTDKTTNRISSNISLNTVMAESYGQNTRNQTQGKDRISQPRFVTYTTPPLEEDLKVWGPVSFTLFAATAEEVTSDWSVFVKMGEMLPGGVPLNPVTGEPEVKPEINDPFTPEVQIGVGDHSKPGTG
jgi:predicted acyl esterase